MESIWAATVAHAAKGAVDRLKRNIVVARCSSIYSSRYLSFFVRSISLLPVCVLLFGGHHGFHSLSKRSSAHLQSCCAVLEKHEPGQSSLRPQQNTDKNICYCFPEIETPRQCRYVRCKRSSMTRSDSSQALLATLITERYFRLLLFSCCSIR